MDAPIAAEYEASGYCLLPDLIPPDLVQACRQRVTEIVDRRPGWDPR